MTAFIYTVCILMGLSAIGKLIHLVQNAGSRETPRGMDAFDVALVSGLIAWGISVIP